MRTGLAVEPAAAEGDLVGARRVARAADAELVPQPRLEILEDTPPVVAPEQCVAGQPGGLGTAQLLLGNLPQPPLVLCLKECGRSFVVELGQEALEDAVDQAAALVRLDTVARFRLLERP